METTKYIWFNGKMVNWEDAKINVITHALHYGSAAFEGIRAYKTDKGAGIFRLEEHIDRLFYSADALAMKLPYTKQELMDATCQVVAQNNVESCYIRPIVFYGYGAMGVSVANAPIDVCIACWPWGAYMPHEMVDVKIVNHRRLSPHAFKADAKIAGHYINSIMASLELKGTHYHEGILLDEQGYIAEGPGENVFFVKNGKLITPKLGNILAGITRRTVITLANDMGIEVEEKQILPNEAYEADEAFYSGTAVEICPIHSIDDHIIGNGKFDGISKTIKEAYNEAITMKNPKHQDWVTLCSDSKASKSESAI